MRIVHGSDWHGFPREVPAADMYVFTGDMLPNFPVPMRDSGLRWHEIVPSHELQTQELWIRRFISEGGMQRYLGNLQAPIMCVAGNHDFADIEPLFRGCGPVFEFRNNELTEILGLRISGHRGIPFINGRWAHEMQRPDLMDRVRNVPECDVLLTHYPPALVLDGEVSLLTGGRYGEVHYGLEGMLNPVMYKVMFLHCFGHIHGSGGRTERIDSLLFSNAATTFNVIDI